MLIKGRDAYIYIWVCDLVCDLEDASAHLPGPEGRPFGKARLPGMYTRLTPPVCIDSSASSNPATTCRIRSS